MSDACNESVQPNSELDFKAEIHLQLEIERTQFFLLKNDTRKQLANGKLQFLLSRPSPFQKQSPISKLKNKIKPPQMNDSLTLIFIDHPSINLTLFKSNKLPCIKTITNDYIFLINSNDTFVLYIDMSVNASVIHSFEELISKYTSLIISNKQNALPIHRYPIDNNIRIGPPDTLALAGMKLAEYIKHGTIIISKGIRKTTQATSTGINKSKEYLVQRIEPNDVPSIVSPSTKTGLQRAKLAGTVAVKISGALVTGAMTVVHTLSNEVTQSVQETEFGQKMTANQGAKSRAMKEIVKASALGIYTIYDEAVNGSVHILNKTSHATADVIGHKYGHEMCIAANSGADIVGYIAQSTVNINRLGIRALAKRMATTTTVDCLSCEEERKENQSNRLSVDPITGLQIMMAANVMNDAFVKNKNESKRRKQEYIGILPLEESDCNYKTISMDTQEIEGVCDKNNDLQLNMNSNQSPNMSHSIFEEGDLDLD